MRAIALLGSPRKQGNTDILADEVLRGAHHAGAEIEKVYLDDKNIRPIGEVCDCTRKREDPRADDDYPEVLERFLDSDIVIFATPVYWHSVSAQLKCFIDRMSSYFNREPYTQRFAGKGYLVLTAFGSEDPDHGKWVTEQIRTCLGILRGKYLGDLCVSVYQKGKVREMPNVLESAYQLGKRAVVEMRKEGGC